MTPLKTSNTVVKVFSHTLVDLPSPASISGAWNMGSLLGGILGVQILTGVFLAAHFSSSTELAFKSVDHIMRDVNLGWLIRMTHANGASVFFMCGYLHAARGMYYGSFRLTHTWSLGVSLLLVLMATAFLGYVLPWGQMSFWGATVITNLFSAIPLFGSDIVSWLWGGFSVDNATLTRFFSFHFLFPFILVGLTGAHLVFLHESGSSSPLGTNPDFDKVFFHPFFSVKDLLGVGILLSGFLSLVFFSPWLLGDPENFIEANPMVTPVHIQPEWYFLFAYAILRSIPNKLGGVVALAASVIVLYLLPFLPGSKKIGLSFFFFNKMFFWSLISCVLMLTWIGARPVEEPFIFAGQSLTLYYFSYFFLFGTLTRAWDKLIK